MSRQLPTAQEIVEQALAASTADGQVTFVVESSEANLRWAGNSLTTNGAMRSRHVVVISFVDGGAGMAAGTVTRTGTPDVAELVAASEQAARDAGPAEDAVPLVGETPPGAGDWDAEPGGDLDRGVRRLRPRARPGLRRGARPRRAALRLRRALDGDHLPRQLHRAAAAARPAHRPGRAQRQEPRLRPLGVGRRRHPRLPRRLRARPRRRGRRASWPGRSAGSSCPPAGTRRCCRRRRSAT